jgi:SAM-dependent methyltransferase
MGERTRRTWDAYWSEQIPTVCSRTMTQLLDRIKLEYLEPSLPPAGRLVEVGCGSARLSALLAARGRHTVCVDHSLAALEAARRNYRTVRVAGQFVAADAFRLPFPEGTFDAVLSTGLLEHFADPFPLILEMARVLRSRGVFYADIVPRKCSLFRSLDWLGRIKRAVDGAAEGTGALFERSFTSRDIRDLLDRAGLVNPRIFPAGVVPPYIPILYRSRHLRDAQVRLVERTQALWKGLDGTWVAEWLGFYYFTQAIKP